MVDLTFQEREILDKACGLNMHGEFPIRKHYWCQTDMPEFQVCLNLTAKGLMVWKGEKFRFRGCTENLTLFSVTDAGRVKACRQPSMHEAAQAAVDADVVG